MTKILIIRFSSIGDIIQNMSVVGGIKNRFPDAEIHWVTRKDMSSFLNIDKRIHRIWAFDKTTGLKGLLALGEHLKKEKFDYIYDAHNNIRSVILSLLLVPQLKDRTRFVRRSKERFKRFLLFRFGINKFPKPFKGIESYRNPLKAWGVTNFSDNYADWEFPQSTISKCEGIIQPNTITLVPSANWDMKRWPVDYWQKFILLLKEYHFIVLAGPTDTFCQEIVAVAPERCTNLAGKTSLMESCYLIYKSHLVISGDTGLLHMADMFRRPAIALMGPSAFGFPTNPSSVVMEIALDCRPCTKDGSGKCKLKEYKKCMMDITPNKVAIQARKMFS